MEHVFIKVIGFVIVILIGFYAKKFKILKKEDGYTLATIIMNITLPCTLFMNVTSMKFNSTMVLLIGLGLLFNIIMVFIGYIAGPKYPLIDKAAYMINCSGYNIGNFTLPLVQSFFPGMGIAYLCMFDVGNCIMGFGGTYAIASSIANKDDRLTPISIIKRLFSSVPFTVYILILIISFFNITIPDPVISITSYIGAANGFLVMLMIGLLLEIKMDYKDIKDVCKILTIRFIASGILSVVCYFALPVDILVKKILVLSLLSPVTTMATVFSRRCGYERDVPAVVNSLSIIISMILSIIALMLFV